MIKSRNRILWVLIFLHLLLADLSNADLPIHALIKDVIGDWVIYQSDAQDGIVSLCGSSMPNRNTVNLIPELNDYRSFIETYLGGVKKEFKVTLSDLSYALKEEQSSTPHRLKWESLAALDTDSQKPIGYWTPVYDEGFELRMGNKKYIAFYKYYKKDFCGSHDGDNVPPSGVNECYTTDPSATHIGWFHEQKTKNDFSTGCFYAKKTEGVNPSQTNFISLSDSEHDELSYVISKEFIEKHNSISNKNWVAKEYGHYKNLEVQDIVNRFSPQRQIWRENSFSGESEVPISLIETKIESKSSSMTKHACSCKRDVDSSNPYKILTQFLEISQHNVNSVLPIEFSWGDPYLRPDLMQDYNVPEVPDQKSCGSCYAMATTYVLQHRFEIHRDKQKAKEASFFQNMDNNLSPQTILSCSFYNQGCNGGYPFLVAKHAYEIGIPNDGCMNYEASHDPECRLLNNNQGTSLLEVAEQGSLGLCMENQRWYAKDYGYVGGCFECNGCDGEKVIMEEIYNSGPVVAALDAAPSLLSYSHGIFDDVKPTHLRVCDSPTGCGSKLSGWEYTNHAIAIVGWGEEKNSQGSPEKYWVVRNTWGKNWGKDGYFKIIRGKNLAGIENQAVYVDPDFSRGKGLYLNGKKSEK